jgi:hypothetical protein
MRHPPLPLALAATGIAALVLGLGACSQDDTSSPEVASLEEESSGSTAPDSSDGSAAADPGDPQEAALDFAKCMREHGIDMPDPQFDSGGGRGAVTIGVAGDPDDTDFQAAQEECGGLLGEMAGSFTPPDPEEQARFEEAMLDYAACMREHGVDFPDPQMNGGLVRIGEGIDPDDPAFTEADEACRDELPGPGPMTERAEPAP